MPSAAHCKLGPRRDGPVETTPVSGTETVPSAVLGISITPSMQPWCLGDLLQRFQQAASSPDKTDVLSLRQARHRLSLYWLASPTDQLEFLYSKEFGDLQRLCVEHVVRLGQLFDDEQVWRDQLQALLQASVGSSAFLNYWLALMPYLQPGELRLDDPSAVIPPWLLDDYTRLCEPDQWLRELFPLCSRRDQAAREWLCEDAVLARAVVLLNGYQLDPKADDQLQELAQLRLVVAQFWLDLAPDQVQPSFDSPIGLLTRSLVVAGFHQRSVLPRDGAIAAALQQQLLDCSDQQVLQQLFAALLFGVTPDVSRLGAVIPAWCREELRSLLV